MGSEGRAQRSTPKKSREERITSMDKDILDVEGAAMLLGVSSRTKSGAEGRYSCDTCGTRMALCAEEPHSLGSQRESGGPARRRAAQRQSCPAIPVGRSALGRPRAIPPCRIL